MLPGGWAVVPWHGGFLLLSLSVVFKMNCIQFSNVELQLCSVFAGFVSFLVQGFAEQCNELFNQTA